MPDCVHHWRIETPEGPTSKGVCRKCKAKRVFQSYADEIADFRSTGSHRHIPRSARTKCPRCSKWVTKEYGSRHMETCDPRRVK